MWMTPYIKGKEPAETNIFIMSVRGYRKDALAWNGKILYNILCGWCQVVCKSSRPLLVLTFGKIDLADASNFFLVKCQCRWLVCRIFLYFLLHLFCMKVFFKLFSILKPKCSLCELRYVNDARKCYSRQCNILFLIQGKSFFEGWRPSRSSY